MHRILSIFLLVSALLAQSAGLTVASAADEGGSLKVAICGPNGLHYIDFADASKDRKPSSAPCDDCIASCCATWVNSLDISEFPSSIATSKYYQSWPQHPLPTDSQADEFLARGPPVLS